MRKSNKRLLIDLGRSYLINAVSGAGETSGHLLDVVLSRFDDSQICCNVSTTDRLFQGGNKLLEPGCLVASLFSSVD